MYNFQSFYPGPHPKKTPEYDCDITIKNLKDIFASCSDFQFRTLDFGLGGEIFPEVCWLDGVVSGDSVSQDIIRPLTDLLRSRARTAEECARLIKEGLVYSYSPNERTKMDDLVSDLTHGHCAIVFDSLKLALCFEVRTSNVRSISEPTLEKSLKGGKDSFVETLRINTSLVRRRICSPKLKLVESSIGRKSNTRVAMMFIDGVANPAKVEEIAARLDNIDVDALLSTGMLEAHIVDAPLSPFPQLLHTERPDRFAMYLSDGRIGLLVDGLPVGVILPASFGEFMKVTGDNGMHFLVSSSLSLLRYLALVLSLFLPALYVAVAMYHQEMIPTKLLLSIIDAKQDVPFSTALEVLSMLVAFGLLQEAGLRLPNPIGDTVSIIGALIVGQSAVEARLVSPIAIIVVAVSGIACYTLPSQDMGSAIKLCRLLMLLAAIAAGFFGIGIFCCILLLHLAGIDSFGVNYTAPLSGGRPGGLLRMLLRRPIPERKFRNPDLNTPDRRRQK